MRVKIDLRELAAFFSCNYVLAHATAEEKAIVRRMQNQDAYRKLHIVACLFCFVQLFFIISDLLSGFYIRIAYSYLNLSAELLILLSSICVLAYVHSIKDPYSDRIRAAHFVYYLFLETGFLLYLSSDMLRGLESINNAFFNMIVPAIFAVYSFKAVLTLTLYISGVTLALIFAIPGMLDWERIQLFPLFLLLFFICASYFRARNSDRFLNQAKLEAMAKKFQDISTKDFLTRLPNRTALNLFIQNELPAAVAQRKTAGFLMLDIDDFKHFNDFHSHMEGDHCLSKIGDVLLELSNEKFKAFRYGGEEFLIIGIDVSGPELCRFAADILTSVNSLRIPREDNVNSCDHVTVSVGCGLVKLSANEDYQTLLRISDQSLYQAKRQGKNCYVFQDIRYTV